MDNKIVKKHKKTAKMAIKTVDKERISRELIDKVKRLGISYSEASKQIGLSPATITNVKNKKWQGITDAWRKIEAWCYLNAKGWNVAQTKDLKRMVNICRHAQSYGLSKAVSFRQGSGKSFSARHYAESYANVYYIECENYHTKTSFMQELCSVMGLEVSKSIGDMVAAVIQKLNNLDKPLLIIDEYDQLQEAVFKFYKTFYNKCNCGFVLIGGVHFKARVNKGVRLNKQAYCEIYSRFGAEFLELYGADTETITKICHANGIFEKQDIKAIVKNANGDLRRVNNDIEKLRLERLQRARA